MRQLYVIGDPVAHSLSPLIQRAMIRQTGAAYRYDVRTVRPDELADFVAWARDGGCAGCNVTMPLKEAIVPLLDEGAAVTTSRNDVDYIVTEYGVAALKGQTLRQRARNLIEIAHPDFRDELKAEYEKRFHCKY